MSYPTITPLPAAPQRTQDPEAFSTTADTFVAALPDLVTEVNAAGAYIDNKSILVGNDFKGTYSAGTNYAQVQSVLSSSKYYVSLVNSNTGNTPASSPSQWSEIAGAPSVAGEASFTATGTITAGDLVSLLSDGTVSKSTSPEFDTPTQVVASDYDHVSVCHVPGTQKYVAAYKGASGFGNAVVVDYTTGSAVIGTPVVFNSANTELTSCVYHNGQDVVVIAYYDTAGTDVEIIAASISGTTLTFGSMVTVTSTASTRPVLTVYDSVNQAIVVGYDRTTPYARVFTASGTTLTAGSETLVSSDSELISMSFDVAAAKVLFSCGSGGSIQLRVGTVSGTTLSLGAVYEPTVLRSTVSLEYVRLAYSTEEGKTYAFGIISLDTSPGLNIAFATVVNISGTNPTFGRIQRLADIRLALNPAAISTASIHYSAKENAFYAYGSYEQFDTYNTIQFYKITVDGENYTAEPSYFMPQIVQDTSNNAQVFCIDADGSNLSVVGGGFNATNARTSITRRSLAESTSLNWVGIAKASVTNGQTVTVAVPGGTATGLSSLTPGADYYTAGASYAKAGYAKIGKALSATSMLITG
jgi:hypothetical protein